MSDIVTKAAVVQMNSTSDVERNLDVSERLIKEAVNQESKLVVLPENFAYFGDDKQRLTILESLPDGGPILERCSNIAKDMKCELILGGFPERSDADSKSRNTSVHLGSDGKVISLYRKIHMFDATLADGTIHTESDKIEPGKEIIVSESVCGKLGMSICYDLRFPDMYQEMVRMGACVIAVPSAFTETTGKDHWHTLLRARAIETQCYVLAAAQVGNHYADRNTYGHALITDPWGKIVAECSKQEDIAISDIDIGFIEKVRSQIPISYYIRG